MFISENVDLLPYNTFGIKASCRYFSEVKNVDEIEAVAEEAFARSGNAPLVLGGGSNVLFTRDFDGFVIKNSIRGISVPHQSGDDVFVKAGAGENWHGLVMHCVNQGYGGLENLSLIPGNTGASPMQNIGAYGVEIKDVFHELEAFHLREKYFRTFSREECRFGYRESIFKREYRGQFIITSVTYRLSTKPRFHISYGAIREELGRMNVTDLSLRAISQAVINIRSSKLPDPEVTGNAGSFFKNPVISQDQFRDLQQSFPAIVSFPSGAGVKLAAGWLIEQCGWKGFRRGDAGCYPQQALVLVNYGKAGGEEILRLSEEIILSVKEKFGVELEREVNVV